MSIIMRIKEKFNKAKTNKKVICNSPFINVFISSSNNVYSCPEYMVKNLEMACLGNLEKSSFKKIWNSKNAKEIRKRALSRDLTNCILPICANKSNFHMQVIASYYKNKKEVDYNGFPKIITFGDDIKSYVNCEMMPENGVSLVKPDLKEKYFEALNTAEQVVFSYKYDPFSDKLTYDFIKEIAQKYDKIKFNIVSNGILFNKENCDNLGITNRLENLIVFVNAGTKETYDKNVHNGDFETLKQNLNWLGSLKKDGKLKNAFIAFVIDENNLEEMPIAVEFAKETGCHVLFWLKVDDKFYFVSNNNSLLNPGNEKYSKFIEILSSNKFDDEYSNIPFALKRLIDVY